MNNEYECRYLFEENKESMYINGKKYYIENITIKLTATITYQNEKTNNNPSVNK